MQWFLVGWFFLYCVSTASFTDLRLIFNRKLVLVGRINHLNSMMVKSVIIIIKIERCGKIELRLKLLWQKFFRGIKFLFIVTEWALIIPSDKSHPIHVLLNTCKCVLTMHCVKLHELYHPCLSMRNHTPSQNAWWWLKKSVQLFVWSFEKCFLAEM